MSPNLKAVILKNERTDFLFGQIAWAERWLAVSENKLPGTLTHEKCVQVIEDAQDELIEHTALQVIG